MELTMLTKVYILILNSKFNFTFAAPVINEEFFGKQAERVCTQIGECGKFSASDCMGDCACRISKIADVFQTGPTQNAINGFLMQVTALQVLRQHNYGFKSCQF